MKKLFLISLMFLVSTGISGAALTMVADTVSYGFTIITISADTLGVVNDSLTKVVWEYTQDTTGTWVRYDSLVGTGNLDVPDSSTLSNLDFDEDYYFRVLGTDSSGIDTSAIIKIRTKSPAADFVLTPMGKSFSRFISIKNVPNEGSVGEHELFRCMGRYNEVGQDFSSDTLYRDPEWKRMRVHYLLFGEDNNRTFDSTLILVLSSTFGEIAVLDTIVGPDIDTARGLIDYFFDADNYADSVGYNQAWLNDWGIKLWFDFVFTDSSDATGDTMDLDTRYVDLIVEFFK